MNSAIAVSAPVRVDLAGGVTDVPEFSRLIGTDVTNIAIDLFTDSAAANPVGIGVRLTEASTEGSVVVREAGRSTPADRAGNRETDLTARLVEGLLPQSWKSGAIVATRSDLPRRTGLGASSTLAVCLATGFHSLTAERSDADRDADLDANVIVKRAHHAEVVTAGVAGGFQDFIAAFFGGVNHITFSDLGSADLARQHGLLGAGVPDDLHRYLDANLIVVVRTAETVSSNLVVEDHVRSSVARPEEFVRHLGRIKALNAEVFPLLTQGSGVLEDRLRRLGAAMTTSWDQRKLLSSMVGRGPLADIEAAVRPHCLGLHGPGSGANSLLLITAPRHRDRVMAALDAFKPDIVILHAKINTTGVLVERVDPEVALRQDTASGGNA